MKKQKRAISKCGPRVDFVEPALSIACTQKLRKIIVANLQQSAHSRVDPARAGRSQELLEQLETKPVAADRHERLEPVAAAAPIPTPTPGLVLQVEQAAPHREQPGRWPTRAAVKRCLATVTGWARRAWAGGLARG